MRYNDRASEVIHHGALTNSKRQSCFVTGVYPTHITRGKGCFLFATDGQKYIDYICALGSNLFGYANEQINNAVIQQMIKGSNYSLGSTLEVEAAEALLGKILFCNKLRFLKTGTEACLASIRIARAHTERLKILSEGYHGWSDEFVSLTPPAIGVLPVNNILKLIDLEQIDETVAAVIIEPIITNTSPERIQWLRDLRAKCTKHGTLLIFDEIITGIRYIDFTTSHHYGFEPDILLLGKCIGGGLPLSAILTKRGIGENLEWFVSSTFAGDTLALASMMQVFKLLNSDYKIKDLWERGARFISEFNSIGNNLVSIEGYGTRGVLVGNAMNKALFMQEMCKAGFLFGPTVFFCFQHLEFFDITLNVANDVINRIKHNQVTLEGQMPQSPFAQRMRE